MCNKAFLVMILVIFFPSVVRFSINFLEEIENAMLNVAFLLAAFLRIFSQNKIEKEKVGRVALSCSIKMLD